MQKEQITDKEAICILIIFIFGSSLIVGTGGMAENDAWISGIVGIIMFMPMLLIYSRILSLFRGKDLFDILNILFGKVFGKIICFIYILYAFHLGALVLRNYGEFMNVVAMPETPMMVQILSVGAVCIVGVKLGIEIIARTTAYFIPLLFLIIAVVQVLGISKLHLNYLKPFLGNGLMPILKGGFSTFSFPFAETVLFLGIFNSLKNKKSNLRVYFYGVFISGVIIIIITVRNICILGNMLGSTYFSSYQAVSMINIGRFIQRMEVSVAVLFIFGVFIKSSVCLLVVCKGIGKVFNLKDYRSIVIQTGLLMIYFSFIIYDNIMDMSYWAFNVYAYYAFPMQVILPIIIWIAGEIKVRRSIL